MSNATNTPLTDAIRHNILQVFKQWRDGHIYDTDLEGFVFGSFSDCAKLELSLTQSREREERLRECLKVVAGGLSRLSIPADQFGDEAMRKGMLKLIAATDTTGEGRNEK